MIVINIMDSPNNIVIKAKGHAGYAPKGKDIVCAGVSALLFSYTGYCEEAVEHSCTVSQNEQEGDFTVITPPSYRQAFDMLVYGLNLLKKSYPGYLQIQISKL